MGEPPRPGGPRLVFHTSDPEIVLDHDRRVADGLAHWVDGTMGFHRWAGRTTVIAPNGGRLARHDLTDAGFAAGAVATMDAIVGEREPSDHASGGPVHYDEATGQLLLFYHGETFTDGDPTDYYAFVGVAVSDDHGQTFHDLGRIVTSDVAETDPHRHRPVELGPGTFVVRDGWFLVYFLDRGAGYIRRGLSVARARVDDVVEAARARDTPTFTKYHEGRWDEPGVGGRSSELFDGGFRWVTWFDAATIDDPDCVLLVYSTSWLVAGVPHWMHLATVSTDGLCWSTPHPLFDRALTDEIIYLTIDSGGPAQHAITGSAFDLYRTRSTTPFRWDDAWLERVRVRFEVAAP